MGFFKKLWNWVRFKGYKESTEDTLMDKIDKQEVMSEVTPPTPKEPEQIQPEEQQPIKEEVKEIPKPKPLEEPEIIPEEVIQPKTEVQRATDRIEEKPKKAEYEKQLDEEKVVNKELPKGVLDIGNMRGEYEDLFKQKILKEGAVDKDMLDILIENRARFKHRFTVRFEVYLDGKQATTMTINALLPEESQVVYNHIREGDEIIDSQQLHEKLNQAEELFESSFGSIGRGHSPLKVKKGKVTNIDISYDFA